jgi:hypothetical protein
VGCFSFFLSFCFLFFWKKSETEQISDPFRHTYLLLVGYAWKTRRIFVQKKKEEKVETTQQRIMRRSICVFTKGKFWKPHVFPSGLLTVCLPLEFPSVRFVTKRALDSFYQAPGTGCNLSLQLNSVALLPKEERQILKLYQAVPRRAKNRSKQIRPPHQKRLRVVAEEESIVKDMV